MQPGRPPEELYKWVLEYERLGSHRTGSDGDELTAQWLAEKLALAGLTVRIDEVPFTGWQCQGAVRSGSDDIEALAVPYEWEGSIATNNVAIVDLDQGLGADASVFDEPIRQARDAGYEAVVCATRHHEGSLVGVNRPRERAGHGFPVFLVGGAELPKLKSSVVRIDATAASTASATSNVIGVTGGKGKRIMLTTPLNGWFTCAGERGTGIAVLLDLVARLGQEHQLLVVATGGHELGYFGAKEWIASEKSKSEQAFDKNSSIVHIGASTAVETDGPEGRTLIPTRRSFTSIRESEAGPLRVALAPIGLNPVPESTTWMGESEVWHTLGIPLLSVSGAGPDFHTPLDRAERVTSPSALTRVATALANAAEALDHSAR
jgi:hypothetical protein